VEPVLDPQLDGHERWRTFEKLLHQLRQAMVKSSVAKKKCEQQVMRDHQDASSSLQAPVLPPSEVSTLQPPVPSAPVVPITGMPGFRYPLARTPVLAFRVPDVAPPVPALPTPVPVTPLAQAAAEQQAEAREQPQQPELATAAAASEDYENEDPFFDLLQTLIKEAGGFDVMQHDDEMSHDDDAPRYTLDPAAATLSDDEQIDEEPLSRRRGDEGGGSSSAAPRKRKERMSTRSQDNELFDDLMGGDQGDGSSSAAPRKRKERMFTRSQG